MASSSKRKASAKSGPSKKKPKKGDDDDDDFEDALPLQRKPGRYDDRQPGHIATCRECSRKFTVTRYTASHPSGQGQLCDPCSKENKATGAGAAGSGPEVAKKKRAKRVVRGAEEKTEASITTLQASCINVIASNIAEIEALGDIGAVKCALFPPREFNGGDRDPMPSPAVSTASARSSASIAP